MVTDANRIISGVLGENFAYTLFDLTDTINDGSWKEALKLWAQDIVDWQNTNKKAFELWGQDISGIFEKLGKEISSWWKTDVVGALGLWSKLAYNG